MKRRVGIIVLGLAVSSASIASAAPNPKRTVAVLEYRSGSSELPEIDQRLAKLLSKTTSLDVVDAQEARKRSAVGIDREVVRCAGAPACIARLGRRLKAVEVLLVGVSEFGDVILTVQRIDVRRRKVIGRVAEALAAGSAPSDKTLVQYLKRVMPLSDFKRYGMIRIDTNVSGARVTVGKKRRGTTPVKPIRVRAPANYTIKLTKSGYVPFSATVRVPPDAEVKVRPTLSLRGGAAPWYRSWWALAIAGTVVVGAVTTAVIVSRDDVSEVPVNIPPF
jgi:hypothetical protein